MSEFLFTALVFVAFVAALLVFYNSITVVNSYTVKSDKVSHLKIVLISDFHNSRGLLHGTVKKTAMCSPDIIILCGDIADRRRPDYETARRLISELKKIAPCYYITGNHEAALGRSRVVGELECEDILCDESYKIFEEFSVLGISDASGGMLREKEDVLTVFERLDNFKIAAVHRPTEFDRGLALRDRDIDLVLCGHCHGGLVRIPFFGAVATPDEGFFPKYSKGVYRENGSTMIVSSGAGNTFLPLRLNNFPEIVSITVEK